MPAAAEEIRRVVTVFRELRAGITEDGRTKLKSPSGTLSTAEAISVITNGMALAAHFGDGVLRPADVAAGIVGAVVKDPVSDAVVWREYLETVVRERDGWRDFYRARAACTAQLEPTRPDGPVLLGVRHHGPGSARAVRRALEAYRPEVVLIEGPPEADALVAVRRRRGDAPAGRAAGLRGGPAGAGRRGRVLAVRRVLPGVAGDPLGGRRRRAGALLRPAGAVALASGRPEASRPEGRRAEEHARPGTSGSERADPIGVLARAGRLRRPGALVGGRGRAPPAGGGPTPSTWRWRRSRPSPRR